MCSSDLARVFAKSNPTVMKFDKWLDDCPVHNDGLLAALQKARKEVLHNQFEDDEEFSTQRARRGEATPSRVDPLTWHLLSDSVHSCTSDATVGAGAVSSDGDGADCARDSAGSRRLRIQSTSDLTRAMALSAHSPLAAPCLEGSAHATNQNTQGLSGGARAL